MFSWIWVHDIKLVSKSQSTKNTSFRPNEGSILNNNISASLIHDREDPEISHATQRNLSAPFCSLVIGFNYRC